MVTTTNLNHLVCLHFCNMVGVKKAISNINNEIRSALLKANLSVDNQVMIDKIMIELDGTQDKSIYTFHKNR